MATRGRKPAPNYLKLVKNVRKGRINKAEAAPPPVLPEPPDHLGPEALAEWNRIALDLHKAGLLTTIDRAILAAYATAWGRLERAERALAADALKDPVTGGLTVITKSGNVIQHPMLGIARRAAHDVARFAAELGMTPSSRSRVVAKPPPPDDDEAAKYFPD